MNADRQAWIERARSVRIEDELARRNVKLNGRTERAGPCPVCGGTDRFSINTTKQIFNCRGCGKGGDVIALVQHLDSCEFDAAVTTLAGEQPHTKTNGSKRPGATSSKPAPTLVASYDYTDAEGRLLFQVHRLHFSNVSGKPDKTFRQRRPDPENPKLWIWGLAADEYMRKGPGLDWYRFNEARWVGLSPGRERKHFPAARKGVPYRVPELLEALANERQIFIVEGEGKVDALTAWNLHATTNAEGAGKWTAEHAEHLRGADVVVLPDNDDAGRKHAQTVARSLQGIASRIRVLELPGLPAKGDVMDWISAGGTREQLDGRVKLAKEWIPQPSHTPHREPRRTHSARELNMMRFEPIKYVVPGIIVEGLTLLAAKPKMGKSWMMLHAAVAVARDLALEDNLRRLQSRMTKLLGTQEWPDRLFFLCEMPRLAEGGLAEISEWIKSANNPRLVIIDTLAMVRTPKTSQQTNYEADYAAGLKLRELAGEFGVAIVLVHHLRKADADDAFDTISGTLGLTGVVDTILVLKRDSTGSIVLHGRGRDLVEIEKAMTFNPDACIWTIAGEIRDVRTSNERKTILAAMREIELPASPTDIAAAADMKPANVKKLLPRMVDAGAIKKCDYGKYDLVAEQKTA